MSNGCNEPYKLTTGDWLEMNQAVTELRATTQQLKATTERLEQTMKDTTGSIAEAIKGVNDTLDNMPCSDHKRDIEVHADRVRTNRKMLYGLYAFLGVALLTALGWLVSIGFKGL